MADYHDQDWLVNVPLYGASGEISDRMPSETDGQTMQHVRSL